MTGTIQQAVPTGPSTAGDGFVRLTVNGAERRVSAASSIGALLSSLSLDPRAVVVEHNGKILRDRDSLASVLLGQGDVIEIVHFVGGG